MHKHKEDNTGFRNLYIRELKVSYKH